ncbi:hypothetical protein N431DRAFT_559861 [Stipitochalara longipes BDJ]|nr:hypothetical protein N431DRAFT_559861 [Stipitochalara longipes BDJ]
MTPTLGSLGDPILIPDSPPRASYNEPNNAPRRQGFARHPQGPSPARTQEVASRGRCQQWVDNLPPSNSVGADTGGLLAPRTSSFRNAHPRAASSSALALRTVPNDSMVDEYGRPITRKLTQQHRARESNPYMKERAERSLPIQTLPYNVKHSILQAMQKIMEEALFEWAKEWAPAMLKMAGWETAEAGELNWWWRTIDSYSKRVDSIDGTRYNAHHISADAFSRSAGMNINKLQLLLDQRLKHVRHAAVHRDPSITISALKEMLADAHCLTEGLRDRPRTDKLRAIQLALEANDTKWMYVMMATPVSTFKDDFDPKKFRTQPTSFRTENAQVMVLKRKRSESIPLGRVSRQRAGVIENPGDVMDLTMDSEDDGAPATNPETARPTRVIDLTGDGVVVLFRSARATTALNQ